MKTDVLEIAHMGLKQMRLHPRNIYDWRVRREIYKLLNVDSKLLPDRRHQSLAIQAAEHVLPLYIQTGLDEQLVYQLLEAARAFTQNRIDIAKVVEIEDAGYHASQRFGYDFEKDKRNYQAEYAGFAAYKALVEVRHLIDPWKGIEHLRMGKPVLRFSGDFHINNWRKGIDYTDEEWSKLAATGDTAAAAAFAYATSAESDEFVPGKLSEFWEWWVDVALPKALLVQPNAT